MPPTRAHRSARLESLVPGLLLALLLTGCGYRLLDGASVLGPGPHAIAIHMFENQTSETGFERMLADAFQEEFTRRGDFAVRYARGPETELELAGVVREVTVRGTAISSVGLELEDQVTVLLNVYLTRGDAREVVVRHENLRYDERFLASADPQIYENNKEQALRRLSVEIASRINDELYAAY